MKKTILAIASLLPLILPLEVATAAFQKIYVFGDSLSDPGNTLNVTTVVNQFDPTISASPPSPPYFDGRFSNGPVLVDYLANALGVILTPSTNIAVDSPIAITPSGDFGVNFFFNGATTTQSVNFSFNAATSGFENSLDPRLPGVLSEVQAFTDDVFLTEGSADSNALYIIWTSGYNDFNVDNSSTTFAENIAQAVTSLSDAGARNILVINGQDFGKFPIANSLYGDDPDTLAEVSQISQDYNSSLAITLNNLSQAHPDINLILFDGNSLFEQVIADPARFGFKNVTEPCLDQINFTICSDPNSYLFWDAIHPTTRFHALLGILVFNQLSAFQQFQQ